MTAAESLGQGDNGRAIGPTPVRSAGVRNGSRRPVLHVVQDILAAAQNGALRTHIMYKANLNSAGMKVYLTDLTSAGLLFHNPNTRQYHLTDKGRCVLQLCSEVGQAMEYAQRGTVRLAELLGPKIANSIRPAGLARRDVMVEPRLGPKGPLWAAEQRHASLWHTGVPSYDR